MSRFTPNTSGACARSVEAVVSAYEGDAERCREEAMGALAIFERGGSVAVRVWPLVTLGFVEVSGGDYQAALTALGPLIAAAPAMGYGEPTAAPFAPDAAEARAIRPQCPHLDGFNGNVRATAAGAAPAPSRSGR